MSSIVLEFHFQNCVATMLTEKGFFTIFWTGLSKLVWAKNAPKTGGIGVLTKGWNHTPLQTMMFYFFNIFHTLNIRIKTRTEGIISKVCLIKKLLVGWLKITASIIQLVHLRLKMLIIFKWTNQNALNVIFNQPTLVSVMS